MLAVFAEQELGDYECIDQVMCAIPKNCRRCVVL
jgi:hypothetical protein